MFWTLGHIRIRVKVHREVWVSVYKLVARIALGRQLGWGWCQRTSVQDPQGFVDIGREALVQSKHPQGTVRNILADIRYCVSGG